MYFDISPNMSPSKPIAILRSAAGPAAATTAVSAINASPSTSPSSIFDISPSSRSVSSPCAYPSWPSGTSLNNFRSSAPSSFISDEDLFPEDILQLENAAAAVGCSTASAYGAAPLLLSEAPAPPRDLPTAHAMPLAPLYASSKSKKQRRRSSRKQHRPSKPMTPIVESPEVPE